MARLVILSEGLTGKAHELTVEKTTIGRVDDNTFPIPEGSVSSHHCEILLRGAEIVVRDLNSTNGTFINGHQVTGEAPLKPGQILRLGQVEMRLEDAGAKAAARPRNCRSKPWSSPRASSWARNRPPPSLSKRPPFAKKSNTGTKIFIGVIIVIGIAVVVLLLLMLKQSGGI